MAVAAAAGSVDLRMRSSPSKAAKEDIEIASETSSFHSSDASDRREIEIVTSALSARSEEYRLLFRLPSDEVLVQDFNCALQENILLQGHMYLFIHHICFYSNIFGFETKKTIPFIEITCVRKAKTAAIFPNAIEITAGVKKCDDFRKWQHFFGSFLSRDEAYGLIIDGWAQHTSDAKALFDRQEVKSENSSQGSQPTSIVSTTTQSTNDPSSVDRNSGADITEECTLLSNGRCETVPKEPSDINEIGEDLSPASSSSPSMCLSEDVDAPKIPGHFTLVAEGKFPIHVEEFFSLFFSNGAVGFLETYHRKCGDKDIQITAWRQHGNCGLTRDISFLHPIKIYLGTKCSRCQEVQNLHVYRNRHLVIESSKQVSDVPYADYFKVEGIFDVEQDSNDESVLKVCVYSNVAFSKKTMFRGTIEQSTKEECRDIYTLFIKNAHDLLKEKSGQLEGISGQNINLVPKVAGLDVDSAEGPSRQLLPIFPISSPEVSHDSGNNNPHFDRRGWDGLGHFMSIVSSFMELWASFCSSLKTRNILLLILVVSAFAAHFLMQASIIVLLTRAPEVHIVTRENYMGGPVASDNIHWLEKHLSLLKEEMVMVEIRMKKMHLEYQSLEAHMDRLERLKPSHEPS